MNWTGGRLQRASKRQKTSLLVKQQRHFARARANQQSGITAATFVPSFFQEPDVEPRPPLKKRCKQQCSRQTKLEDYTNVAPIAERLSAMGSGLHHSRAHLSRVNGNRMSRTIPDRSNVGFGKGEGIGAGLVQSETGSLNENLPDAISSANSQSPPHKVSLSADFQTSRLSDGRRELLAQTDWMGLHRSRPLQIEFPSIDDKDMMGKRRKLTKNDHIRRAGAGERIHVPSVQGEYYMSGALPPRIAHDTMEIRVGDDALLSRVHTTESNRSDSFPSRASSDSMLMKDDDDIIDVPGTYDRVIHSDVTSHARSPRPSLTQDSFLSHASQEHLWSDVADSDPSMVVSDRARSVRKSEDKILASSNNGPRALKKVDGQTHRLIPISSSPPQPSLSSTAIEGIASQRAGLGLITGSQMVTHDRDKKSPEISIIMDNTWMRPLDFSDEEEDLGTVREYKGYAQKTDSKELSSKTLRGRESDKLPRLSAEVETGDEFVRRAQRSNNLGSPSKSLTHMTGPKVQPSTCKKADQADELWKQFVFGHSFKEDSDESKDPASFQSNKWLGGLSTIPVCELAEADRGRAGCHYPNSTTAENGDTSSLLSTLHREDPQESPDALRALSRKVNASSESHYNSNDVKGTESTWSSPDPLTRSDSLRPGVGSRSLLGMTDQARIVFHKPKPFGTKQSKEGEDHVEEVLHIGRKGRRGCESAFGRSGAKRFRDDIED